MKWVIKKFGQASVSDSAVSQQVKTLKEAGVDITAKGIEGTGDIKNFVELSPECFQNLIKSLKDDNLPPKLVNAIDRAQFMKKNAEAVFDWRLSNGALEYLYIMQLMTVRKSSGMYDILLAHYQINIADAVGGGGGIEASQPNQNMLALSLSQMAALQNYVEVSATHFWKQKSQDLLDEQAADDDDVDDDLPVPKKKP